MRALLTCFCTVVAVCGFASEITYDSVSKDELAPFIDALGELRISVYREHPYSYEGNLEDERVYLSRYLGKNGFVVMAHDGEEVVGMISGIPLSEAHDCLPVFSENNISIDAIFYLGELAVKKEYRGRGIEAHLFQQFENHLQALSIYDQIATCEVTRAESDELAPEDCYFLESLLEEWGLERQPDLITHFSWKELGEEESTSHSMQFWTKRI